MLKHKRNVPNFRSVIQYMCGSKEHTQTQAALADVFGSNPSYINTFPLMPE